MATFLINTTDLIQVSASELSTLPEPFGIVDIESLMHRLSVKYRSAIVKQVSIDGCCLDKKRMKGYCWSDFDANDERIIAILAYCDENDGKDKDEGAQGRQMMVEKNPQKGGKKKKGGKGIAMSSTGNEMDREFTFDKEFLKRNQIDKRVIDGAADTETIREALIKYIKTYNQIRDLEDKNLENSNNLRYTSRDDFFKKMVERLRKDDLGGYIYQNVAGYDLEELIHIATELESKQMENEDWVQLYKHLVDYFDEQLF